MHPVKNIVTMNKKQFLGLITLLFFTFSLSAQVVTNQNESISGLDSLAFVMTDTLSQAVVSTSSVIRKSDRDLFLPSKEAVSMSKTGLALLQNIKIPGVIINPILEQVSNSSGSVELRINGRVASIQQVKAIRPENITKIEYHENPGLRYRGANAVIDIIVKNPEAGGSFITDNTFWLQNLPSGNYYANLQLNNKKGQYGFTLYDASRSKLDIYREYDEHFVLPNNKYLDRLETPESGVHDRNDVYANFSYSYVEPNKLTLYADASLNYRSPDLMGYKGVMSSIGTALNGVEELVGIDVANRSPYTNVALNFYIDKRLKNNQSIVADFVTYYQDGYSYSSHIETPMNSVSNGFEIKNKILDDNYYYGLDANYIKNWDKSRLTAGVRVNGYYTKSTYTTYNNSLFHQNREDLSAFAEYMVQCGPINIIAGAGLQYNNLRLKESDKSSDNLNFQPKITLSWKKRWSNLMITANSQTTAPTISQTNPTVQDIDYFQQFVGNTALESYLSHNISLKWSQNLSKLNSSLQFGYSTTSNNAIGTIYFWDNGKLINTYTNGHRNEYWRARANASFNIVPNWASFSGNLDFIKSKSKGEGYKHSNNSWSGNFDLILSHWNFMLIYSQVFAPEALVGELLSCGESYNTLMLMYNYKNWQFAAGIFAPFGKYHQEVSLLNKYYNYNYTIRSNFIEKMALAKVTYSVNWGKSKRGVNKKINASAEAMQSKAASR